MGGGSVSNPTSFYIITEIPATLIMPDDSERGFVFDPPNSSESPYEIVLEPIIVQDDFDDSTFNLQKGHNKWRFIFRLGYDYHRMELMPVALAKQVRLKVPVYLWNDSRYYQEFVCVRRTAPLTRKSQNGIHAQGVGSFSNFIPNSNDSLEFVSETFEWDEVEEKLQFLNPTTPITEDGEELTGFAITGETEGQNGFTIKPFAPAEFGEETTTTIKVGNEYFILESIIMESNNG